MRGGEMAALGEIPFARYYGSVDSTPLFVMLAGAYYARTGDEALASELWPTVTRALEWIARYGDRDGDGFVEYAQRSRDGLRNQGWKDSEDSVFHADGRLAEGAIALCEVQGYVYAAKRGASRLAGVVGERERAKALLGEARALRAKFEGTFWCDDLGTYALALDGASGRAACARRTPATVSTTGIASPTRARLVASTLGHPDMFSGWGVRTVASDERRYNPMSYHNGSVWPHDNAIVAAGLARYHQGQAAERILQGMFDTCQALDLQRLPSSCAASGACRAPARRCIRSPAPRRPGRRAPSTCSSSRVSASRSTDPSQRIRFTYPRLPGVLDTVWISNLRVGHGLVDLELRRHGEDVGVNVPAAGRGGGSHPREVGRGLCTHRASGRGAERARVSRFVRPATRDDGGDPVRHVLRAQGAPTTRPLRARRDAQSIHARRRAVPSAAARFDGCARAACRWSGRRGGEDITDREARTVSVADRAAGIGLGPLKSSRPRRHANGQSRHARRFAGTDSSGAQRVRRRGLHWPEAAFGGTRRLGE
jgi:hypothetical protein